VARPQRASEMTRCANRGLTHCSRPPTRSPRRCGQAASADFEAQRLASPEIDAQFDSGGLLDSQVGGLLTSENPPGIDAALIDSTPPSHCRGSSSSRWPRRMCVMDSRTTLYIFADRAPLHQLAAIPFSAGKPQQIEHHARRPRQAARTGRTGKAPQQCTYLNPCTA
jgi:hypothetical protein